LPTLARYAGKTHKVMASSAIAQTQPSGTQADLNHSINELPNLLIVGGPKCGTTSLFDWLEAHPDVCGSSMKETYYFMDTDNPMLRLRPAHMRTNYHDHGLQQYAQFFQHRTHEKITVEATPHYMYQETTPRVFSQRAAQPLVIFLLRQPSKRVRSHFNFSKNNLLRVDAKLSFEAFANALLNNNFSELKERIYDDQAYFWLKNQLKYSRYHEHLQRWAQQFSPENRMIFLFEDMVAEPKQVLQQICHRLDIDPSFYDDFDFTVSNGTVPIRFKALRRLVRFNKQRIKQLLPVIPFSRIKRLVKSTLLKRKPAKQNLLAGSAPTHSTPADKVEDAAILAKLDQYFQPYNQKLAEEFGLNLDSWNNPATKHM
ncbi:MAG: sulfotransferase domain-containing protein, partial [Cyanobacteria bacterium J06649_4]